jgi:hypothetical protein
MHWRIAAATVFHVVLTTIRVFDRIRRAVFSADETLEGGGAIARRFAAAGNRQDDDTDHSTSQPKSIHCFSPGMRGDHAIDSSNFGASAKVENPA